MRHESTSTAHSDEQFLEHSAENTKIVPTRKFVRLSYTECDLQFKVLFGLSRALTLHFAMVNQYSSQGFTYTSSSYTFSAQL